MAYGSAPARGLCANTGAPPGLAKPCETAPAGGGGAFCNLASGRGRALSISNRDAEIGTAGEAWPTPSQAVHVRDRKTAGLEIKKTRH